ncbi:TIGR04282 family arsenosugar biosynthesis glycosyltransferase [Lutibaculum baratangense]|uniref:TIGR04282 family arsenosugar biosynthesis glycosyltransferase n=1 Tax=Lutibaculum baratangense TaxID=1358440 RepID=UPI001FCB1650|nr:TIGR04282 family arsenosugar biosynthesis glycosyltransferase [Lutibaculum baratangense]
MERPTLVVMAKLPVAGAVKSRLAAEVGVAEATRFYRTTLRRTLMRLSPDRRWRTVLAVAPDRSARWAWPCGVPACPQGRGDLGRRMQRIMDAIPPGPVVIVGSDIPGIRPRHIASAFRLLGRSDAVFGPAEDGGYWLVGLRRRPRVPQIFDSVRWSSDHALADTLANCQGLSVGFAATLPDVDTAAGWRAWRRLEG